MCGYTLMKISCNLIMIIISDSIRCTAQLASRACARLQNSYHPGTKQSYDRMLRDYLAFLVPAGLSLSQVDTIQLHAFMEFLCHNGMSPFNIANYLAAIRANLVICGLSTTFMQDDRIHLFLRGVKINRPLALKTQSVITDSMFYNIIQACSASTNFTFVFTLIRYYIYQKMIIIAGGGNLHCKPPGIGK